MTGLAPEKVRSVPERVLVLIVPSITRFPFPEILPPEVMLTPVPEYPPPVVKELNAASPFDATDQLASVKEMSAPALPNAIAPVYEPVPMLTEVDPVVLILVAPVTVKPELPVNSPAEVIVPVPVVEILPDVASVPSSVIVNLDDPLDWISMALWAEPPSTSSISKVSAELPALVNLNRVELPDERVKSIFPSASVAAIVLPAS